MKPNISMFILGLCLVGCGSKKSPADKKGGCTQEAVNDYNQIVQDYNNFSEKRDVYNRDLTEKRTPSVSLEEVCESARSLESSADQFLGKYGEQSSCVGRAKDSDEEITVEGAKIQGLRQDISETIATHCP